MSARIDIPTTERGVTRVFAVNLPWQDAKAAAPGPLLNVPDLPENAAQIFPVSDLGDLGLTGYLTEGMGLPPAQIMADKAKLSALDGHVLVLNTNALHGRAVTLEPGAALTLIGTYVDTPPAPDFTPLTSDAAKGALAGPSGPAAPRKGVSAWLIAALALVAVLLLILLLGVL